MAAEDKASGVIQPEPRPERPAPPQQAGRDRALDSQSTGTMGRRLLALDAARGLALVGMIIVNVGPTAVDGLWERLYLFPYGRASILFVVVAGIGMGFFLRARRERGRRSATLLWRAAVLLLGGLALQTLTDDVGVILPIYGLLFLSVLLLQHLRPAALITLAAALSVLGPVLFIRHGAAEAANAHPRLVQLGDSVGEVIHGLVLSGRYPLVTWAVPFLLGMWIAHLDLTRRVVVHRLLLWGGLGAATGLVLSQVVRGLLGDQAELGYLRLLTGAAHGQMPLWLVSSCGGAVFTIAVLLRLWPAIERIAHPFTAAGQLALTLYVLHILALAVITPTADLPITTGAAISALMIGACLGLALLWRRRFQIGPLEWVVRATWLHRGPTTRPIDASAVPSTKEHSA